MLVLPLVNLEMWFIKSQESLSYKYDALFINKSKSLEW